MSIKNKPVTLGLLKNPKFSACNVKLQYRPIRLSLFLMKYPFHNQNVHNLLGSNFFGSENRSLDGGVGGGGFTILKGRKYFRIPMANKLYRWITKIKVFATF